MGKKTFIIHCPWPCLSQLSRNAREHDSHTAPGPAKPVFQTRRVQQNLTDHDNQEVVTQALVVSGSERHIETVSKGLC